MGKVKNLLTKLGKKVSKHSPELMLVAGTVGMISAVVLAIKATPKAMEDIQEAEEEKGEELTAPEVVKVTWKRYIPTAGTVVASSLLIFGAGRINLKQKAALSTAYTLSETAFSEYQKHVKKIVGDKKEAEIRASVADEAVRKNPPVNNQVIFTERGNTLCFDMVSQRYFRGNIDHIRKVINELNFKMSTGYQEYISVNEYYHELNLSPLPIDVGWNVGHGLIEPSFSSTLATSESGEEDTPCLVVDFMVQPRVDYMNLR